MGMLFGRTPKKLIDRPGGNFFFKNQKLTHTRTVHTNYCKKLHQMTNTNSHRKCLSELIEEILPMKASIKD